MAHARTKLDFFGGGSRGKSDELESKRNSADVVYQLFSRRIRMSLMSQGDSTAQERSSKEVGQKGETSYKLLAKSTLKVTNRYGNDCFCGQDFPACTSV